MNSSSLEKQICSDAWTNDAVTRNHRALCLTYRGRFSASPDAAGAAAYIENTLNSYGLQDCRQDAFAMTTWSRGTARLRLVEPQPVELPCIALPYAPDCDAPLQLVDIGMGHPADIQTIPGGIAGKAVLVDDKNPPSGPAYHRLQKYLFAKEAGAAAFLFAAGQPGMLAPTGSLAYNHNGALYQTLPSVGIAHEIACELRWWLSSRPVWVHLTIHNTLARGNDKNVVADLRGANASDELIIVCGHYDGHDIAQGATDNASGAAVVMETARLLAPLKDFLTCTVRFVLFGSEEMGLVGSHFMAGQMGDTIRNIRFMFNLDCVGQPGHLMLMLQNCPELTDFFTQLTDSMPSDISVNNHFIPFSDHFPFFMRGVPAAFMATAGTGGRGWGHTTADTFEKVSRETLMRVSMQCARLVLKTALAPSWSGVHKTPDTIVPLLESHAMKNLMEYENHWMY
jgi:aminopeptidase YwaD